MAISIKEFFELESELAKSYAFRYNRPNETVLKKTEDDSKIGYYIILYTIKMGNGKFYKSSKLLSYVVYDKVKKKVRSTKNNDDILRLLLSEKFKYPLLVRHFITKISNTLLKLIILNKIKTVNDILNYYKSYSIRDKNIDNKIVYMLTLYNKLFLYKNIKNKEDINKDNIKVLLEIDPSIYNSTFKFDIKDNFITIDIKWDDYKEECSREFHKIK
jgi:hypothetical protein